jgi:hypothetical protein
MSEKKDSKLEVWFRPDWHPAFNNMLGQINGAYGYVTDVGTINLLGPFHEDPDISKWASESETRGPTVAVSAMASLGMA